jgi:NADH-quinone oxidoreductase subunit J
MTEFATLVQWLLGFILIASSLGVILAPRPVISCLSFLLTLMTLAALYLQLSAEFIALMQILVYAGAILVLFMFVIILFQDAHEQIDNFKAKSNPFLLMSAAIAFIAMLGIWGSRLIGLPLAETVPSENFGMVEYLGKALYVDFFFPFETVILIFIVAVVGALYIGKKEKQETKETQGT